MARSTKPLLIGLALAGAFALAADARAGNIRSAGTPAVSYWYRVVDADHYLKWTGTSTDMLLIDDITYYGHPVPGTDGTDEEACVFDGACSFFDIGPNDDDFGAIVNENSSTFNMSITQGTRSITSTSTSTSSTGSTMVHQAAKRWIHGLRLVEAPPIVPGRTIDWWTLTGHAYVAVRETTRTGEHSVLSTTTDIEGNSTSSGGIGLGVGTGTGVGAAAWLLDTSVHRPYQTPWVLAGHEMQLLATNFPSGHVLLRGRVISDSGEQPARSDSFTMQPLE